MFIGCANKQRLKVHRIQYNENIYLDLREGYLFSSEVNQIQVVRLVRGDDQKSFNTYLSIKEREVHFEAFTVFGSTIYQLYYKNGVLLHKAAFPLPDPYRAEYFLFDLLAIYGDLKKIRSLASEDLNIREIGSERFFYDKNDLLLRIQYEYVLGKIQTIKLINEERGYQLIIEGVRENKNE